MNEYTVVLLAPDYLAANFGQEIVTLHLKAPHDVEAVRQAQRTMFNEDEEVRDPSDYHALFVCKGHMENLIA